MRLGWLAVILGGLLAGATAAAKDPAPIGDQFHWRLVGPFRGGWATTVIGVPDQVDTFYFGAAGGGVWKTVDAGRTWRSIFDKAPAASIGALTIAPSNPEILYAGTGQPEPRYDMGMGSGVFRSNDGGAHWTSLGLEQTRQIGRIWVDPRNADTVLVGAQGHFFGPSSDRGIYRSTDGGRNWAHVLKTGDWTGVVDIASDPGNPDLVFAAAWEAKQYPWLSYFAPPAGAGSTLYRSRDGGNTWSKLGGVGWPSGPLGRISLAVVRLGPAVRIYATVSSGESGGLYRSDDGGAHWLRVNATDKFTNYYASRLEVAPDNPDTVYTVGQSIRRCVKAGAECEIIHGAPGGDDYHQVWINPRHPDHIITGSDQGAQVSVDGGVTWSSWYNQPTGQFYHLATDDRFPYWIYSGQQDSGTVAIASRGDYGAITLRDWHPVGGDERDYDIPDPGNPDIVYASGLGGRVTRFDARTGQVADVTPFVEDNYGKRPTLTKYRFLWVTPLVASRTGTSVIYLGAQLLFRSQDQGRSWQVISGDLTGKTSDARNCDGDITVQSARPCGYGVISAIAPSPVSAGEIWVGTDDGLIHATRDGGTRWVNVTPDGLKPWEKIASIDLSAKEPGAAYAAVDDHRRDDYGPHIWRTHDGGRSWNEVVSGLPHDEYVTVVRSDPQTAGLLFAGTSRSVYVSFDDGDHWQSLRADLPTAQVNDLLVHGDDLVAATQGRAIWILDDVAPLREWRSVAQTGDYLFTPARAFRVHSQNNKDTPQTAETPVGENPPIGIPIDYWLSSTQPVTLSIADHDGRVVRTFSSSDAPEEPDGEIYFAKAWLRPAARLGSGPGFHRFVWNLRESPPDAVKYEYGIGAVWGRGTPISPGGAYVPPGDYTVTLQTGDHRRSAPLHVAEDPRVAVTAADLAAADALSRRISHALSEAATGHREIVALHKLLEARFPHDARPDEVETPLLAQLRGAKADGFDESSDTLAAVETALESADAAPTPVQQAAVEDAVTTLEKARDGWTAIKNEPLAQLNRHLAQTGASPLVIADGVEKHIAVTDEGEDTP